MIDEYILKHLRVGETIVKLFEVMEVRHTSCLVRKGFGWSRVVWDGFGGIGPYPLRRRMIRHHAHHSRADRALSRSLESSAAPVAYPKDEEIRKQRDAVDLIGECARFLRHVEHALIVDLFFFISQIPR